MGLSGLHLESLSTAREIPNEILTTSSIQGLAVAGFRVPSSRTLPRPILIAGFQISATSRLPVPLQYMLWLTRVSVYCQAKADTCT